MQRVRQVQDRCYGTHELKAKGRPQCGGAAPCQELALGICFCDFKLYCELSLLGNKSFLCLRERKHCNGCYPLLVLCGHNRLFCRGQRAGGARLAAQAPPPAGVAGMSGRAGCWRPLRTEGCKGPSACSSRRRVQHASTKSLQRWKRVRCSPLGFSMIMRALRRACPRTCRNRQQETDREVRRLCYQSHSARQCDSADMPYGSQAHTEASMKWAYALGNHVSARWLHGVDRQSNRRVGRTCSRCSLIRACCQMCRTLPHYLRD
jgi:hypothetical protein